MTENNAVKNISDEDFEKITGSGVTLVDFWAPWCYPCRIQAPILEKLAEKIGDKAQICKLNVDENGEVAMKYGITGIPTLLIFKDGKIVNQFMGVQDDKILISALEALM
ncbi:MAG: thioredoxin [Candidatus Aminicenantes bacterium]|nr:thioredoxin [Candidatus Aminicenantes bacterium]NIM78425.1 thioredoxin [Candidatus Aminicenantes bacterium]NIN17687.1 thioredoxin [Candidatus Aminicenantes bacterium]NIN41563.1 thioredoxin [Candidatus Aminicenantes bacterium]NIN84337.1 thioredoxin [Candidatus Aminicenantes bacterium]